MNQIIRSHHDLCFYAATNDATKPDKWPNDLKRLYNDGKFDFIKKHGFAAIRPVGP